MAPKSGRYDVPDFKDEPIEEVIGNLRRCIASDCSALLSKARKASVLHRGSFDLKKWEARVSRVREAQVATFSIEELENLKKECAAMSAQLEAQSR